jgi:hypothetical protein
MENLTNALYTKAQSVSQGVQDKFTYVYTAAANGAVTTVKGVQTFVSSTIDLPFLVVPFKLIDPHNYPIHPQQISQ